MEKDKQLKLQTNFSKQLIQITKTSDLLRCKPINEQLIAHGKDEVYFELAGAVVKCAQGLGIEMSNERTQLLVDDITEVYKFDSIEDIQLCLKNGRQGKYGKTYGKLNMIIIQEWMSIHLEKKAAARESQNSTSKHDFKTREEYESAVKVGSKINEDKKDTKAAKKRDDIEYEEYRAKYLEQQNKLK